MTTTANALFARRTRLSIGLAIFCLAMLAGCGNDLSEAKNTTTAKPTKTTRGSEATGAETTTSSPTTSTDPIGPDGSSDSGNPTGITLPDGSEITFPKGADLTIPDGLGECVEAGAALGQLSLALLGATSTATIDEAAGTLKDALGPGSTDDIEIVATAAREAAESDGLNPGAITGDASSQAIENLGDRVVEVCGGS